MQKRCFYYGRLYAMALMTGWLLLNGQDARAQGGALEKTFYSRISGSTGDLINGAMADLTYVDGASDLNTSIKNIITLSINEESQAYIPDNFTATVTVKVEYGASSTSLSPTPLTQDLTVTYNKGSGVAFNPKNFISFSGAVYVKITAVTVNAPALPSGFDPKTVLLLQNEMRVWRYFELSNSANLSVAMSASAAGNDMLSVGFTFDPNAGNNTGYQLEWTWVEDELLASNYTKTDGTTDYDLIFKNNATRVDLPVDATGYTIPLFYDGQGNLYFRVRAVNTKSAGNISYGPWTRSQYAFGGHDNNLNWQVTTSYAEEGKRKSVMQYYDGSLRMRQTVTKDNTTNTTVTAETFYDGQGRPAIQILPAPGISTVVAYTKNLNLFNGQATNEDPALSFDLVPANGGSVTPALTPDSGAALYYSAANTELSQNSNQNLPDAQGYPYSVTRYNPDATGRIMSQSGVGKALNMGSGHETKYFYGNAAQEELDGLFGTESGNFTHYFKNMVKDANGQMSVSYVDMHGRTVATALAGDAPTGLTPLDLNATQYPGQAGSTLNRNLLDKNSNVAKDNSIESMTSILVPATTAYQFKYSLDPDALSLAQCNNSQLVCYDCQYDLEIAITDESGDLDPIVRKFTNVSLTADNSCSTGVNPFTDLAYNGTVSTLAGNVIQFSETLQPGSYSIRKTLTISQSSMQTFRDQYLQIGLCKTQQQLIDSVYSVLLTTSDCNTPPSANPCQSCLTALGTFSDFRTAYIDSLGTNVPPDSVIHAVYSSDSARCAGLCLNSSHTLAAIRSQMLSDMMPYTGQYAKDPTLTTPTTMYNSYDIFATGNFRVPLNAKGNNYYDAAGNIDATIQPIVGTVSASDFTNLFAPSWAESLLPHHPEYQRLLFAEQTLSPSYDWIDNFSQVTTFAGALSGGYTTSTGNSENNDPFFALAAASYKTTMTNIATTGVYYNNLSLWQIAYGDAACKTITDLQARDDCYRNAPLQPPFTSLTTAQQDQAWGVLQGLYRSVRDSLVMAYTKEQKPLTDADNNNLVLQGYILRMPTSNSQIISQYGWTGFPSTPGDAPTVSLADDVAAVHTSRCSSYIDHWKQELSQCAALAANPDKDAILTEITTGMEAVCEKGLDESNPYGASSVAPGTLQDGSPRSFEEVINNVFTEHGISKDQYCNPFVIDFPKPYGKSPAYTQEIMTTVDTCACNQFAKIKQDAIAAQYDPTILSSINQYLNSTYQDTLTQVVFDGLQHCSVLGTTSCHDVATTYHYPLGQESPCPATTTSSSIAEPPPGDSIVTVVCHSQQCEVIWYYALASPQPKPAFLDCGFTGNTRCVSCAQLSTLVVNYKAYFNGMACAAAPVLTTDNLTPDQIGYNITFQQYVNYQTGLPFNWLQYASAASAAGCDLSNYTANSGATQNVLCGDSHPLNDTTGVFVTESPCQKVYNMAIALGTTLYQQRKAQLLADFEANYRTKCLSAKDIEQFSVQYGVKEYHYTLYYYDLAGGLVKTVPPKGARPDFSSSFIGSVEYARAHGGIVRPAHLFETDYRYNSLGEVIAQQTPDAGLSHFWYDRLGRLAVSQQAQQYLDNKYSYTLYDPLGRITEVGQKPHSSSGMSQTISQDVTALDTWINTDAGTKEQITNTVYDIPVGFSLTPLLTQQNLRNRVSYTYTRNYATDVNWYTASYYTYDIHGNVDTLLQDYLGISAMSGSNHYKRICYDYDLISGKVNGVDYQPGSPDAFYHRYQYDAENRLVQVLTSRDSIVWERDAAYSYYKHGPLSRTVLGQLQLQGLDYNYTLQGWLKGINAGNSVASGGDATGSSCPAGSAVDDAVIGSRTTTSDPATYSARSTISFTGEFTSLDNDNFETVISSSLTECTAGGGSGTGLPGSTEAYPVGLDAYNFSLHYYPGDYQPIGTAVPVTGILEAIPGQAAPLYNGNIAAMAVNVPTLGDARVYNYHYDALNRLSQMDAFSGLNSSTNTFTPVQLDDYKERVGYDPNGNIMTYLRNGTTAGGRPLAMDNLTYNYSTGTNKLSSINDAVSSTNYTADLDDQVAGNYTYDAVGNLKSDHAESIYNIDWNVYGKILRIQRNATGLDPNPNTDIQFSYDASGNRITKTVVNDDVTLVYVRDAQGNVLSIYRKAGSADLQQIETDIYGSSRLALVRWLTVAPQTLTLSGGYGTALLSTFTRGEKSYELSNHLGNELVTVSDKKIAVPSASNSSLIDHYTADVANAQDYYPFGMQMPGRTYLENGAGYYRYGFNGKENDNEVEGVGNQIDYGMRVYDPRAGRFMSVDPLTQKYPWYSPYQFAGNKPVWKVDVDGMEEEGEEGKEAEADEIEKDQEKEESQARLRNALKTPTAEEQAKNRKEMEEWLRKSPEERAKEGVRSFFQNLRNGAKNYGQNALNAAQGVLGGPILSTDPQWQVHEEGVYNDLLKNNPQGQFGKQITLDVYNKNGQMETIRGDILFKSPGSQMYELVDAKYSAVKDLTNVNLKTTLTESQQAAYEWIKTGQAAVIIPRGGNGAQLNFAPGVSIKVSPQIKIAVNVPQTPQNQAQYGTRGILYRNY